MRLSIQLLGFFLKPYLFRIQDNSVHYIRMFWLDVVPDGLLLLFCIQHILLLLLLFLKHLIFLTFYFFMKVFYLNCIYVLNHAYFSWNEALQAMNFIYPLVDFYQSDKFHRSSGSACCVLVSGFCIDRINLFAT